MAIDAAAGQVETAAKASGLMVVSAIAGESSSGTPTTKYVLALNTDPTKTQLLELGQGLSFDNADLREGLQAYLAEGARRLRNPRPDCYLSLIGIPLSFGRFAWPFHHSTSGADTSIVHGEIRLEDGGESVLQAQIAASLTVTFQEVVGIPEQPFAEGFIYNAVRKTLDQGQIELVKSGNRQPVPVTTRYYSARQRRFVFNDTAPEQRKEFLAGKAYWLSGVLGSGQPVWLLDPRDAQYLNTTVDDMRHAVQTLVSEGIIAQADAEYGAATARLMEQGERFREELASGMLFLKPSFNEEMRSGSTNM